MRKAPNKKGDLKEIDGRKFLAPDHFNVTQLNEMIRKRIEISGNEALYLLVNGKTSIKGDTLLIDIYEKNKDPKDGFLYIAYAGEIIWGNN